MEGAGVSSMVRTRTLRDASPAAKLHVGASRKPKIVVVLGAHRSGSSAITRGLTVLGVELGDNLMRPVEDNNEKGFFEDLDIYQFNESVLRKAGSAWHKLARLDSSVLAGPSFSEERQRAAALLSRKLQSPSAGDENRTFGFKDPRTAILLPLWQPVFEELGLDDRYVISVRHPMESATSLEKRDGFSPTKGVFLWAKHMLEAVRRTEGRSRLFVSYERVLEDPLHELDRIAQALDLPKPAAESKSAVTYATEFLNPALRHHVGEANEMEHSGLVPSFVAEVYRTVASWAARDEAPKVDPSQWRSLELRFEEVSSLLDYADLLDDRLFEFGARLKSDEELRSVAEAEIQAAAEEQRRTKAELESLRRTIDALQKARGKLEDALAARANEASRLRVESMALRGDAARLNSEKEALRQSVARLACEKNMLGEERNELNKQFLLARAELNAIRHSTSWNVTAPLRITATVIRKGVGAVRAIFRNLVAARSRRE